MKVVFFILSALISICTSAQTNYQWYNKLGEKVSFETVATSVSESELILFGELHDNPYAHQFQLELGQFLFQKDSSSLVLGAEMFERHQTAELAQYLKNADADKFEKSTELWSNFRTDYLPLLKFASTHHIPYTATNITRPYASLVFKYGQDTLTKLKQAILENLCPLPYPLDTSGSQYQELLKMGNEMGAKAENFAAAQSVKDATMAWFIVQNIKSGGHFLHLNGSFHSDFYQSICFYIKLYSPETTFTTISVVESKRIKKIKKSDLKRADFILVTKPTER